MKICISIFSKRCLLVFLLTFLFAHLIYTQETPGSIRIKFRNSMASSLKSLDNKPLGKSKDGFVKTGISTFDQLSESHKVVSMKRVFRPAGKFEERHVKYGLHLWYELKTSENNKAALKKAVDDFKKNEGIEVAEPIYDKELFDGGDPVFAPSFVSNDPMLSSQWHYQNTGQTGGTLGSDIKLTEGWNIQKGSKDVIVAVIDGGIDVNHVDLNAAMWVNTPEKNGIPGVDDDGNGYIDDINGYGFGDHTGNFGAHNHGTHVAGTIGAVSNNGTGVAGIAGGSGSGDGVRLMSCATFGTYSSGGFAEAFVYAADMGAVIAQNSWGYIYPDTYEQTVMDAIDYFIANAGKDPGGTQDGPMAGGIVIFAAGNDNSDDHWYPGYYDHVLSVASINHTSHKAYYSNFGSWVDVSAPGGETIYATQQGVLSTLPGNSYGFYQGTSMACPHVSGLAALIVSQYGGPGLTPQSIWEKIVQKADNIDLENPAFSGKLGTGCINSFNSLTPSDSIPPAAITDLAIDETSQVSVTLSWTATGASGVEGKASSYDLRYGTFAINEENFETAIKYAQVGLPKSAGEHEIQTLQGLNPSTKYYFALKAIDSDGNHSPVSNITEGTTEAAPVINITPLAFHVSLNPGNTDAESMVLQNNGTEILNYSISVEPTSTWLSYNPATGNVEPGETANIELIINSAGLAEGSNNDQTITVLSNDPLHPVIELPFALHIIGTPVIQATDTINFGMVMTGDSASVLYSFLNIGTDLLVIDSVIISNDHFAAICSIDSINSLDSANLMVWYKPNELHIDEGSLFIYSNDHVHSPLTVHLTGQSVPAPEISASPDSFMVRLHCEEKSVENLEISNSGGTNLDFSIQIQYKNKDISRHMEILSESPENSNSNLKNVQSRQFILKSVGASSSANILLLEDVASNYYYDRALENLGLSRTLVTSWSAFESAFLSGKWDLIIVNTYGYRLQNVSLLDSLKEFEDKGGKVIFATWDMESYKDHPFITQSLGVRYIQTIYLPLNFYSKVTTHPVFNNPNIISQVNWSSDNGYRDGQIAEPIDKASAVASFEGYMNSGSIILNSSRTVFNAFQSENYNRDDDYDGKTDIVEIIENEITWLISGSWLKPVISEGQVEPGKTQNIQLLFDAAGLMGGDYYADLEIASNDPKNQILRLPAHLNLQGAPVIRVNSDTLDFGTIFSPQSDTAVLTISNIGTDILHAGLSVSDDHFTLEQDTLDLVNGDSLQVKVIYHGDEIQQNEAILTISSNDPVNPEIAVFLLANCIEAPVIIASPDSFNLKLKTGDIRHAALNIENSGGSDLNYQVEIHYKNNDISSVVEKAALNQSNSNENLNTNPDLPYIEKRSIGVNSSFNVLLLENGTSFNFYDHALQNLGISRVQVTDNYAFLSLLSNGTKWDLVIVNTYGSGLMRDILDTLNAYKGKIIFATWDLEYYASHPFITQKLGVNFISSITQPLNFGATVPDHQIFNYPNIISHFQWTHNQADRDGQISLAAPGFIPVASFAGYESSGSIILNNSKSTIYNAFQAENYYSDNDGDGKTDMIELIENEVTWLLSSRWLKALTNQGVVIPGSYADIDLEFDANDLTGGDYYADILINSNDPETRVIRIPARMNVEGVPVIKVNPGTIDFGRVFTGQAIKSRLTISNTGSARFQGTISIDNPHFRVDTNNLNIAYGDSISLMVTYRTEIIGTDAGVLTITGNAEMKTVFLAGISVEAPLISLSPDSFFVELESDQISNNGLTINNEGGSTLEVRINVFYENKDTVSTARLPFNRTLSTEPGMQDIIPVKPSIKGSEVLVIQDDDAWGLYMSSYIQNNFGFNPDVINSSQIQAIDLSGYKVIITTGDQSSAYYSNISNNAYKLEDFVRQGGIMHYQLATQGDNVTLVNNVHLIFGHLEFENINLLPEHPIFAGLPVILHGSYANHCYFDTTSIPENAVILTKTWNSDVPTTIEYKFGLGRVVATGMTWELYHMFDDSVSVLKNACEYTFGLKNIGWLLPEKQVSNIDPGNSELINLQFNASGLDTGDYKAIIQIISNDPSQAVINVPAHLHVIPAETSFNQLIPLQSGWNIFSLNVLPDNVSMKNIVQHLINSGSLVKIQSETGAAIEPIPGTGNWIDNIGNWNITEGYKIRLCKPDTLEISGNKIDDAVSIDLQTGWNIVSYPYSQSQDAMTLFNDLILKGHLMKVQNEKGAAIEPLPGGTGWINNIGTFLPGEGYKIRISTNDVLTYVPPSGPFGFELKAALTTTPSQHFKPVWQGNGVDHMNVYVSGAFNEGDEIGIYDGDLCVGTARINSCSEKYLSIAVSADDPETKMTDGFVNGNPVGFRIWNSLSKTESSISRADIFFGSRDTFEPQGTIFADLAVPELNSTAMLKLCYPNPFSERTLIPFTISENTDCDLAIYDIMGKRVKTLMKARFSAGSYECEWNGTDNQNNRMLPGIYYCRLIAGNRLSVIKLDLIK